VVHRVPAGRNNRLPTAGSYAADTLANFELGWKTSWLDRRLPIQWRGFLRKVEVCPDGGPGQYGITSIVNAGDAKVEGLESELQWAVDDHLTFVGCGHGLLRSRPRRFLPAIPTGSAAIKLHARLRRRVPGHTTAGDPQSQVNGNARYTSMWATTRVRADVGVSPELHYIQSRG